RELDLARAKVIDLELRASTVPASRASLADDSGSSDLAALEARAAGALLQSEEALINQLALTDESLRAVVGVMDDLEQTLNEALLWFPSHAPVSMEWVRRMP